MAVQSGIWSQVRDELLRKLVLGKEVALLCTSFLVLEFREDAAKPNLHN